MICVLCGEFINSNDETSPIKVVTIDSTPSEGLMHRECALRNVLGGIGHLTDHYLWCVTCKDPDGGHTYRESALLVDEWVRQRGREN